MLTVTNDAAEKIRGLMEKEGKPGHGLRVFVSGGGCSGYQYGLMFDDNTTDDDEIIESDGVKVFVDGESAMLLYGAEIDYVDSLMGAGFTIRNPNAVSSCACGQSFNAASDAEAGHGHGGGGCGSGGCGSGGGGCACGGH